MARTYRPPKGVQDEAQRALQWIADGKAGENFTDTGRERARQLANGESLSDASLASLTFDLSPPDGSRGVLVGFVGGDDARTYVAMGEAERRANVLAGFARLYGPEALEPAGWAERQWAAQEWSGGGPVAIAPPRALTGGGDLREQEVADGTGGGPHGSLMSPMRATMVPARRAR